MSPEEFVEAMQKILDDDKEDPGNYQSHMAADDLLCDQLMGLGFDAGVAIYDQIGKWYA